VRFWRRYGKNCEKQGKFAGMPVAQEEGAGGLNIYGREP
jgi:hypothetical protein